MKIKDPSLFKQMKEYLMTYLPVIRRRSANTVSSSKETINLFLLYLQQTQKKRLSDITTTDFNQANIVGFMSWLQRERGNTVTTVNQRLSHIRGFCQYIMKNDALLYGDLDGINDISRIRDTRTKKLVWLSIEDMQMLLQQPDTSKKTGIRDRFFLALLYDSGCRIEEIISLKVKDFVINRNGEAELHVIGKGAKYRCTPITSDVIEIYRQYCHIYRLDTSKDADTFMFYTVRNGIITKMSDDNVRRFMNKYDAEIRIKNPEIPHLHPHLMRHTRAMHLNMAGVPLPLIAEWLGHSRMETTQIYAQATVDMKRKAAQKLGEDAKSVFKEDLAFKYADNDEVLKILCGLK